MEDGRTTEAANEGAAARGPTLLNRPRLRIGVFGHVPGLSRTGPPSCPTVAGHGPPRHVPGQSQGHGPPRHVPGQSQGHGRSGQAESATGCRVISELAVPVFDGGGAREEQPDLAVARPRRRSCRCRGRRRRRSSPSSRASPRGRFRWRGSRSCGRPRGRWGSRRGRPGASTSRRRGRGASACPRGRAATPPRGTRSGTGRCSGPRRARRRSAPSAVAPIAAGRCGRTEPRSRPGRRRRGSAGRRRGSRPRVTRPPSSRRRRPVRNIFRGGRDADLAAVRVLVHLERAVGREDHHRPRPRTWWAPSGPVGKQTTSPRRSTRSPSGSRSVGVPVEHDEPLLHRVVEVVRVRPLARPASS